MLSKLEGKIIDLESFGFDQGNQMKIRLKKCSVKVKEWEFEPNKIYNFFDYFDAKKVN